MTPGEFIAAFDVIAEAPGGIERLRELVLQLAVRGKLVPQDEGEEPASELLRRIADEKSASRQSDQNEETATDDKRRGASFWNSRRLGMDALGGDY